MPEGKTRQRNNRHRKSRAM